MNLVDSFVAGGLVIAIALASLFCCKDDRPSVTRDESFKNSEAVKLETPRGCWVM